MTRSPRTYQAEEVAAQLGVSTWALYQAVRRGDCPVAPIRVGRRLVWPKAAVDQLLGLANSEARPSEGRDIARTTLNAHLRSEGAGGARRLMPTGNDEAGPSESPATVTYTSNPSQGATAVRRPRGSG